ncbi:MAG TPA: hypothetical protein VMU10_04405, partial [Desulfomonilia bacterium]|nr:hypothetical protein [Desulfomonilia bacterium]
DVSCVVYREHGFWPEWVKRSSGTPGYWLGKRYTRYNYLAKDIDGNIHVLQSLRPNETDVDDTGIIVEGGTTLMYPADPKENQPVYQGYVIKTSTDTSTGKPLAKVSGCTAFLRTIKYGLDSDTLADITEYVQPGWGPVETDYKWHDASDYYTIPPDTTTIYSDASGINGYFKNPTTFTFGSAPNYIPSDVVLHGYTFSDDSANIWENPYFGAYTASTITTYAKILYGYGDFKSYDTGIYFDSFSTVDSVNCVVLRVHGYKPTATTTTDSTTGQSTTTFTFEPYTEYDYYAKDSNGNIHLLRSINGSDDFGVDAITANGGTTLMYPSHPAANQLVYDGMVVSTNETIGTFTGCMSIRRGASPTVTFDYYQADSGLVTTVYNWGETSNGISLDQTPSLDTLPTTGGTDAGTQGSTTSSSTPKKDNSPQWYECFIDASAHDSPSAAQGMMFLVILGALMSLRAVLPVTRK